MTGNQHPTLGSTLLPVDDVPGAVAFYHAALAFPALFVDGDTYAAVDGRGGRLTFIDPSRDGAVAAAAIAVKVGDVQAAVESVVRCGGEIVQAADVGSHEVRAVMSDPWGNLIVLYAELVR